MPVKEEDNDFNGYKLYCVDVKIIDAIMVIAKNKEVAAKLAKCNYELYKMDEPPEFTAKVVKREHDIGYGWWENSEPCHDPKDENFPKELKNIDVKSLWETIKERAKTREDLEFTEAQQHKFDFGENGG